MYLLPLGSEGGEGRDASVLVRGEECVFVGSKVVEEVCVGGGGVPFISARCVLQMWESKYCGQWYVLFLSVCAGYRMFHSSSHAGVVIFGVYNAGPLPCEGGVTTARGEDISSE
jgi:hypothetical protein